MDKNLDLLLTSERALNRDIIDFTKNILHAPDPFPNQAKIMKLFYDSDMKELLIVCGKKSGKDFMAAIFGLYMIYKLLLLKPSPQEYFGILPDQRIYIPNVAVNKQTATNILLDYTKRMIGKSDFLKLFLVQDMQNITNEEIRFINNLYFKAMPCVSSASLGYTCGTILLDEFDFFSNTKGESSSQEVYDNMVPNLQPMKHFGKVIMITSPNDVDGIANKFASEIMRDGEKMDLDDPGMNVWINRQLSMMFVNAPTWVMNPNITRESLERYFERNPVKSEADYGAQFLSPEGLALNRDKIKMSLFKDALNINTKDSISRVLALDPGITHDAYGLVMGYKHSKTGKFVFDYAHHWQGSKTAPVQISEVEDHIRNICSMFKISAILLDQHQSASTVQRLSKEGLPIKAVHIGPSYNFLMYTNLIEKLNSNQLEILDYPRLIAELRSLRRTGVGAKAKFAAPTTGTITSDDLCLSPDTLVLNGNNKYQFITEYKKGDFVSTIDGPKKIINVFNRQINEPVYEVKVKGREKFKVTQNHPFKTDDGSFKTINNISHVRKDFITISGKDCIDLKDYIKSRESKIDCFGNHNGDIEYNNEYISYKNGRSTYIPRFIKLDYKFGFIIGAFCAEGSFGKHSITFNLASNNDPLIPKLTDFFKDVFGFTLKRYETKNNSAIYYKSSIILKELFHLFVPGISINKELTSLGYCNLDFLKGFIEGLFKGDGCMTKRTICLSTTSHNLAYQTCDILNLFKIYSNIHISKRKGNTVLFRDREKPVRHNSDLYCVRIGGSWYVNPFIDLFWPEYISKQINDSIYHHVKELWFDNFVLVRFKKKMVEYSGNVYNLEVQDVNEYTIGSATVHNCDAMAMCLFTLSESENEDDDSWSVDGVDSVNIKINEFDQKKANEEDSNDFVLT